MTGTIVLIVFIMFWGLAWWLFIHYIRYGWPPFLKWSRWRIVETTDGFVPEYFIINSCEAFDVKSIVSGWYPIKLDKDDKVIVLKKDGSFLASYGDMYMAKRIINKAKIVIEVYNDNLKEQKRKKKRHKHYV